MVDRQLFVRVGVAVVALGAVAGGFVLLTSRDEAPPANAVAVVDAPSAAAPAPRGAATPAPQRQATSSAKPSADLDVVYELTGSGTATVVYDETGLGLVHQELAVPLPWKKEFTWPASAAAPSVQLIGQGDGAVQCSVSVRGTVVVTQQSKPGEVATCAGKLS